MAYVETQGYFSRLIESIKGVLFGIVLFLVSFPLLWWNEGRAVQTAKSLEEGAARVVPVAKLDPTNEGKLVHFTGQARTDELLSDHELGVSAAALRLQRRVEMYQWYEKSTSRENVGGSKTTVYTYDKKWSELLISSSSFKEAGHTNPSQMRIKPSDVASTKAKLGDFDLGAPIISEHVDKWESLPASVGANAAKLPADLHGKPKQDGDALYVGDNPSSPAVGDCRITYRVVKSPLTMSIVAKQAGRGFVAYPAKAGDAILLTAMEAKDANAMFKSAEESNETLTWILRGVGWLCMTFGIFLVLKPISMVANFIPLVGSMVSFGAFLLSAAISSALSLVTVAAAWIFYRPLIGILVLVGAFGGLALAGVMMAKARRSKAAS
jgi:hypothetical protein